MGWRARIAIAIAAFGTLGVAAGVGGAYDWSQALAFDVSAQPKIDRAWNWTLQEQASPAQQTLYVGETRSQSFLVSAATNGSQDTRWLVGGVISINPNPIVQMTSIDGTLYTGPSSSYTLTPFAVTDCPGGLPQMMVNHVVCSYQVPAPQANTGFVGITAHACIDTDCSFDSKSSSAPFDFANATVSESNACVTASESAAGSLGSACRSTPASFTATRTIGPYSSCGDRVVNSTTSLTGAGGATVATGSASVDVHVASRLAQWWLANVTNASYADLVAWLQQQITAIQARLTSADPPAISSALSSIQSYLTRYSTWNSLPRLQQIVLLGLKSAIDAYAARCA